MKRFILIIFVIVSLGIVALKFSPKVVNAPISGIVSSSSPAPALSGSKAEKVRVLVSHLNTPWAIAFLPGGNMLVTERPGNLNVIDGKGKILNTFKIDGVKVYGEGGLLGVAVSKNYQSNKNIFLYYTFSSNGENTLNRLERFTFDGNELTDGKIIVDNIPGSLFHNGGRLKFGPDGFLYITAGDAQQPSQAQDKDRFGGKILRVDENGNASNDNPFGTIVYSYGHRNPQGLAWDSSGQLWEVEHGNNATDEVNKIAAGNNYGWPTIIGNQTKSGMVSPFVQSGTFTTWAPSGLAFSNGFLYFSGLRGQGLYRLNIETKKLDKILSGYGRIREAVFGPDGLLYLTTSNRDGRGLPTADDDRVIVVDTSQF